MNFMFVLAIFEFPAITANETSFNRPMVKPFRLTYLAKGEGGGCQPPS